MLNRHFKKPNFFCFETLIQKISSHLIVLTRNINRFSCDPNLFVINTKSEDRYLP